MRRLLIAFVLLPLGLGLSACSSTPTALKGTLPHVATASHQSKSKSKPKPKPKPKPKVPVCGNGKCEQGEQPQCWGIPPANYKELQKKWCRKDCPTKPCDPGTM